MILVSKLEEISVIVVRQALACHTGWLLEWLRCANDFLDNYLYIGGMRMHRACNKQFDVPWPNSTGVELAVLR